MSDKQFLVFVPWRPAPILISADVVRPHMDDTVLSSGDEVVGFVNNRSVVVSAEAAAAGMSPSRPEIAAAPAELATFITHPAPVWPALVGLALGLAVGAGTALGCVGFW